MNSLSSPETCMIGLLNGPVPLAFTAAILTEYSAHATSPNIVRVVPFGTFMIIISSDPTLEYWIA